MTAEPSEGGRMGFQVAVSRTRPPHALGSVLSLSSNKTKTMSICLLSSPCINRWCFHLCKEQGPLSHFSSPPHCCRGSSPIFQSRISEVLGGCNQRERSWDSQSLLYPCNFGPRSPVPSVCKAHSSRWCPAVAASLRCCV